eukprot:scaffold4510_cov183-Amphora_coffeaeformis.AAC.119
MAPVQGPATFLCLVGRPCALRYDGQGRRKDAAGKTDVAESRPVLGVDELAEGRGARPVGGFVLHWRPGPCHSPSPEFCLRRPRRQTLLPSAWTLHHHWHHTHRQAPCQAHLQRPRVISLPPTSFLIYRQPHSSLPPTSFLITANLIPHYRQPHSSLPPTSFLITANLITANLNSSLPPTSFTANLITANLITANLIYRQPHLPPTSLPPTSFTANLITASLITASLITLPANHLMDPTNDSSTCTSQNSPSSSDDPLVATPTTTPSLTTNSQPLPRTPPTAPPHCRTSFHPLLHRQTLLHRLQVPNRTPTQVCRSPSRP